MKSINNKPSRLQRFSVHIKRFIHHKPNPSKTEATGIKVTPVVLTETQPVVPPSLTINNTKEKLKLKRQQLEINEEEYLKWRENFLKSGVRVSPRRTRAPSTHKRFSIAIQAQNVRKSVFQKIMNPLRRSKTFIAEKTTYARNSLRRSLSFNWGKPLLQENLVNLTVNGEVARVKIFLEENQDKINLNYTSLNQKTVLHIACEKGNVELAKMFIHNGALIDKKDNDGRTPLHYAAQNGNEELVKLILEKGHKLNFKDNQGYTPLHLAIKKHKFELVPYLVLLGEDINNAKNNGKTCLHECMEEGDVQVLKFITSLPETNIRIDYNAIDLCGDTPLFKAVIKGHEECVRLLLEKKYDVLKLDAKNEWNQNVFHLIATHNRKNILQMIYNLYPFDNQKEMKEIVNEKDRDGTTPLTIAVKNGCVDIVQILVKMNANVNEIDVDGNTPLHFAIQLNKFEIAQFLCLKGASGNIKNNQGVTPKDLYSRLVRNVKRQDYVYFNH